MKYLESAMFCSLAKPCISPRKVIKIKWIGITVYVLAMVIILISELATFPGYVNNDSLDFYINSYQDDLRSINEVFVPLKINKKARVYSDNVATNSMSNASFGGEITNAVQREYSRRNPKTVKPVYHKAPEFKPK